MSPTELKPDDLPEELGSQRREMLVDLSRLWLRLSDYRFGQMLRTAAVPRQIRHPTSLTDEVVSEGLVAALEHFPERPPPKGPYWDTEAKGQGSFLKGRPRDPARISQVLAAFADAWVKHPDLWFGQLLDFALDRAGIPEGEYGSRWLLLEDGPIRRALADVAAEPDDPFSPTRTGAGQPTGPVAVERERFFAWIPDSRDGLVLDPDRFHDIVGNDWLAWSGLPPATPRRRSPVAPSEPVIAIHAGARGVVAEPRLRQHYEVMLREALANAQLLLERGDAAVDVVRTVLWIMETLTFCNLYLGAPLCSDGSAELSAAIMRGFDRAAGAVGAVRRTKHPIVTAKLMLDDKEVMRVGDHADGYGAYLGVEQAANLYFINERQRANLALGADDRDRATIGAVCLDATGGLAAGTVTGGLRGQPKGRVGAASLIGAGIWADERVAVSCAGDSEAFIRSGTARHIATLVEGGISLEVATEIALADLERLNRRGGLIAVTADGEASMPFTSKVMVRGVWRPGDAPRIQFRHRDTQPRGGSDDEKD
jgi:isoaspartyl peptidase/L-asparaginase-like protein (Ntn-hydrolase superfamily)